jgi:hypothetical protein
LDASQRLDAVSKPAVQESDGITVQSDSASPSAASLLWDGFIDELRRARVSSTADPAWDWRALAGVALLAVAAIGLLRIAAGIFAVQSLIARSQPVDNEKLRQLVDVLRAELSCARRVEIRQSSRLTTAATVGWRRPVILLPLAWGDWTRDQRRAVLAHELAHIRQADFVAQLAAQFALALHFYHPLVHWLARRLRLEQELTADDLAANVAGGRRAYMNTLAQLALAQPSDSVGWPAQMFLPTRGMFLRRIEMLRDSRHFVAGRGSTAARWAAGGLIVLFGLLAVGLRLPHLSEMPAAVAPETFRQAGPGDDPTDTLIIAQAAFDASFDGLKSGHGHGVLEHYERVEGAPQWTLVTDGSVETFFSGRKYHIRIDYSRDRMGLSRRIIIYDEKSVTTSRFSDLISRTNCEANVFSPEGGTTGMTRPRMAHFRWDVSQLSSSLLNVGSFLDQVSADRINSSELEEGGFVWEYTVGKSTRVLVEFLEKFGFNPSRVQVFAPNKEKPTRECIATWRKQQGIWFVDSISEKLAYRGRDGQRTQRLWKLKYDEFEVNADVSPELFTMAALDMPASTRILDHRPDTTERIRYVPVKDEEVE